MTQFQGFTFTKKNIAGLCLIYLAGIGWAAEVIIPFTPIGHKVALLIPVLITAELAFVIGVALVGRPLYRQLKAKLLDYIKHRP